MWVVALWAVLLGVLILEFSVSRRRAVLFAECGHKGGIFIEVFSLFCAYAVFDHN